MFSLIFIPRGNLLTTNFPVFSQLAVPRPASGVSGRRRELARQLAAAAAMLLVLERASRRLMDARAGK